MESSRQASQVAAIYREVGERHGWRKGRNSPRGYDVLTLPSEAWDDRPHDRYVALVHNHMSTAASLLACCPATDETDAGPPILVLARAAYVESAKVNWLLDERANWIQRAARAHVELWDNLDSYVRVLPKVLETGFPNFVRRRWKIYRDQFRDDVLTPLFGKKALSRDGNWPALWGEELLSKARLIDRFDVQLSEIPFDGPAQPVVAMPDLLIDSVMKLVLQLNEPLIVDPGIAQPALRLALREWDRALRCWAAYNGWGLAAEDITRMSGSVVLPERRVMPTKAPSTSEQLPSEAEAGPPATSFLRP